MAVYWNTSQENCDYVILKYALSDLGLHILSMPHKKTLGLYGLIQSLASFIKNGKSQERLIYRKGTDQPMRLH